MQNQSTLALHYDEINVDVHFPVTLPSNDSEEHYNLPDLPITFLHYHNIDELGYCYEGNGVFFIDGKVIPFQEGDATIIFAGQIHIGQSLSRKNSKWDFSNLNINRLLGGISLKGLESGFALQSGCDFPVVFSKEKYPEITDAVYKIFRELSNKQDGYKEAVRALLWYICICLNRLSPQGQRKEIVRRDILERISPAINYMMQSYADDISIDKLCDLCNMSASTLRRMFVVSMGIPPFEYLTRLRIKMAATELKESSAPVIEIAGNVGYNSISSFNRHFLEYMNMTPRQWRKP